MRLISQDDDQVDVRLRLEELVLMRKVLHEICRGMQFTDADFVAILDAQRSEVEDLLRHIENSLYRLQMLPE